MSTMVMTKGSAIMEKKILSISSKRQITIPQKFFTKLGFDSEAECLVRGNELVLRPVKENNGGEFAEYILQDLIKEGFNGEELLIEFRRRQAKVRPAVEKMIAAAQAAANGEGEFYTYEDVFGTEDDE